MRNIKIFMCASCVGLLILMMASCKYDKILPPPPPTSVSFNGDLIPIFNSSCNFSGCHSGAAGDTPPDLSPANAYSALINGNYVDLVDPENSLLYRWMKGDEGLPMPPTGTVELYNSSVLVWIQEGAQDN